MYSITEDTLEQQALKWFEENNFSTAFGPDFAPEGPLQERTSYEQVILTGRLKSAIGNINKKVPTEVIEDAVRQVTLFNSPSMIVNNESFHKLLTEGVDVTYQSKDGTKTEKVFLIDFKNPDNNEFLVVNQFTIIENKANRRPDLIVFINGLPIALIELKNPADQRTDIWAAFNQIETYKKDIPTIFNYNEILVISDGIYTRLGSLSADRERFQVWRTIEGEELAPESLTSLEVIIKGLFNKERLLDFIRYFVVFEQEKKSDKIVKKIAGYHQFHAVRKSVDETIRAVKGNHRIGVVWHTQGSGKSLTMTFFSGKVIQTEALENPTIVVITDRNDLDDQLFGQFSKSVQLLRQEPIQIESRQQLREELNRASGGIIFTTVHKFMPDNKGDTHPLLSNRKNIIVMADEAHRSQYDFLDGFARHMRDALPEASYIGFTGTPIEKADANTPAVFGDYISVYDVERAIKDESTVPIYYESRLISLDRNEEIDLDLEMEKITEADESSAREDAKTKWARLEALVGLDSRNKQLAADFVNHWEARLEVMDGKAMIVCMSRRICIDLYNAIVALRPDWASDNDNEGVVKVIMTGSASDSKEFQPHIRTKARRESLAELYKDPKSSFKIVIVRDMWLTGFDAPCMHTMYIDKPMRDHGLMQAIARVNRVFKDKPGGLIVDYLGIADQLKKALATYTASGGKGNPSIKQSEAIAQMQERLEICQNILHGFKYQHVLGKPSEEFAIMKLALNHILDQDDGKMRFSNSVYALSKAFALCASTKEAADIRQELIFFQSLAGALNKRDINDRMKAEDKEHAIKQLISKSVSAGGVIDIFDVAGISRKQNIAVLSDEFLAEIKGLKQRNLAVELLERLLKDQVKMKLSKNKVQERQFSEMLDNALRNYKNRAMETAKIIEELIKMAKELREAHARGEKLGLDEDSLAFYDALAVNDSAVRVLGNEVLKAIAVDLAKAIKDNLTTDWAVRETERARVRVMVKRLLRKHGYPPDKTEKATELVLEQAEQICAETV